MQSVIEIIDARIEELRKEAERILAPYNAAVGELQRLKEQLKEETKDDNDSRL